MIRPSPRLDQFAELLSLNLGVSEASRRMNITVKRGHSYLAAIRKRLGWQAV